MAITVRSRADLIRDLENEITQADSTIETGFGPIKDIVIDPVSLVVRDLYIQLRRVFNVQFLRNAQIMTTEELDLLGESLGVKRKGATRATGSVFFLTGSRPSSDITIPSGTPVITNAGLSTSGGIQTFITTINATLFAASADAFFNPDSGKFELECPVRSITPGSAGQVSSGAITVLQRSVPPFGAVLNKSPTNSGRDAESNSDYARRIRLALLGTAKGAVNGVERFALSDDRVTDAKVIMSGDNLMKRTESVAGAVDVYIVGEEPTVTTQTEIYDGLDIAFDNEPLIFPGAVTRVTKLSTQDVLTEGTDYFVVQDPVLDGSLDARNLLRWNRASTTLPALGDQISIEYMFDKLIFDIQTSFNSDDNNVLANVLFRRSTVVDVVIEVRLKLTSEIPQAEVLDNVRTAIREFINSRGLGESVIPSDIDVVIRGVPGVDFVFLPFDRLSKTGENGSDIIPIEKNEFAHIADSDITLVVSS